MPKLNRFSLYLAKADAASFEDVLTTTARELIKHGTAESYRSSDFADDAVLYTFPGQPVPPKWVGLLKSSFPIRQTLLSQTPSALLMFKAADRIFAVSFSYAHAYLDDSMTEGDFGLRTAINAVSSEKLRSVERSNIGAAIRDFAQAAGQRDLSSFGFDDALDLIRKVSGRAADTEFANTVTGARSLRFSKQIELDEVPKAAEQALTLFNSTSYRKTGFKIIDFLSPVLDPTLEARLNDGLLSAIRAKSDDFEIALPEIIPEAVGSFRFEHAGISEFHPDLSLDLYCDELGDRLPKLTLLDLCKHTVAAYGENDERSFQHWSVHRSLVGSLVLNGERFALNEGQWYRISKAFKDAADKKFVTLRGKADRKLRPLKKIYAAAKKGKKTKAAYQSEESYNDEIAKEAGYLLLDQKLIQIDDVPGPGVEACDLLDLDKRRFIHIKKSSRQSSVLSHFFKQGSNSARMLRQYEPFKAGLIAKVRSLYGAGKARELETALPKKWMIDFQIADFPRADGTHNIPFFSKLTLRDEARKMEAMGFAVEVNFIKLAKVG